MKKILSAAAVLMVTASPAVFAQSAAFSGFDVGLGINQSSNSVKAGLNTDGGGASLDGLGKSSTNGIITGNYFFPLDKNWVLGVGGSYTLGKQKAADGSYTNSYDDGYTTLSGNLRYKDSWGIHITPGYALDQRVMLYGKLSYNHMKGQASGSVTDGEYSEGASVSENFHGIGFGFGARVNLTKNLFIDGVLEQIHYTSKSFAVGDDVSLSIKPKSSGGKITLGYRF